LNHAHKTGQELWIKNYLWWAWSNH